MMYGQTPGTGLHHHVNETLEGVWRNVEGPAAVRAMTALAGETSRPAQPPQDRESDSGDSSAEGQAIEGQGTSELSNTAMEDAKTPVHYFVMGPEAAWHSTSAWPPPELAPEPYTLFLGRSSGCAPLAQWRSQHCFSQEGRRAQS